jgi:protein ImuB
MRTGQRDVITAACPVAISLGLHPGMAAAHARALVADLEVRDADPDGDKAWLDRLALHAVGHWTPTAASSGQDGLWLDLSGSSHLFGGEERFCRRLLRFLERLGFSARIAIAGTPGAAHALARYGGEAITLVEPGREAEAIAGLPVAALRLAPSALEAAARFGLERIGDLYGMRAGPGPSSGPRHCAAPRSGSGHRGRADRAGGALRAAACRTPPARTDRHGRGDRSGDRRSGR